MRRIERTNTIIHFYLVNRFLIRLFRMNGLSLPYITSK